MDSKYFFSKKTTNVSPYKLHNNTSLHSREKSFNFTNCFNGDPTKNNNNGSTASKSIYNHILH